MLWLAGAVGAWLVGATSRSSNVPTGFFHVRLPSWTSSETVQLLEGPSLTRTRWVPTLKPPTEIEWDPMIRLGMMLTEVNFFLRSRSVRRA